MEDTLRAAVSKGRYKLLSLNPCSNGRYSQRLLDAEIGYLKVVLILVLMEDTLRVQR